MPPISGKPELWQIIARRQNCQGLGKGKKSARIKKTKGICPSQGDSGKMQHTPDAGGNFRMDTHFSSGWQNRHFPVFGSPRFSAGKQPFPPVKSHEAIRCIAEFLTRFRRMDKGFKIRSGIMNFLGSIQTDLRFCAEIADNNGVSKRLPGSGKTGQYALRAYPYTEKPAPCKGNNHQREQKSENLIHKRAVGVESQNSGQHTHSQNQHSGLCESAAQIMAYAVIIPEIQIEKTSHFSCPGLFILQAVSGTAVPYYCFL